MEIVGDEDLDFTPHECVGQDRSFVGQLFNSPETCQSQLKLLDDCTLLYKVSVNTDEAVTKKIDDLLNERYSTYCKCQHCVYVSI